MNALLINTSSRIMFFKLTFLKLTLLYCDTGVIVGRMPIALGNSHTHTHSQIHTHAHTHTNARIQCQRQDFWYLIIEISKDHSNFKPQIEIQENEGGMGHWALRYQ